MCIYEHSFTFIFFEALYFVDVNNWDSGLQDSINWPISLMSDLARIIRLSFFIQVISLGSY